ncbi:protein MICRORCHIDIA 6 [Magnolia sinica]|uniref:protein MICRORCHIDIA 6 n=1 Tax=Magnolia sinica TaxID=86752 RepID=UPI00265975C1|nr:protein MICRORCHIDIA 6 [Magnolia sinica]XP_058088890.1 protein MICRORCHIDIA 6 [Magnolia sinica]XP_058088891.1 protein MICRORCHIDIA 6 [Magnolia sinica]XP_058088892.1 protein MICRORCHIDIA 6 [Magnolia sinica]
MSFTDIVDLCSDEDEVDVKPVKQEPDSDSSTAQNRGSHKAENVQPQKFKALVTRIRSKEKGNSTSIKVARSSSCTSDQESSVVDGSSPTSAPHGCSAPICRQFWKAGDYDIGQASKMRFPNGSKTHLRVHPKFLHSNATSHKWALGAIAELLDNAVDEIQNGATFVIVDKISNPRNRSPALLIQDDGGGMDPECIRRCMSFGFSEKKSKSAIGQYGNGFKTSTMRLGADAIVFTRCMGRRVLTQSVGLLSYTFLTLTGYDNIVVPMVDYEFNPSTSLYGKILRPSEEHFSSNLSTLLQWSPYATEAELLKQFDDIGHHGTKVIVFNMWLNDDGDSELDFESDKEDIMISGAPKIVERANIPKKLTQQHIANRYHYSLRLYSSILYLRMPENFSIILRGRVVEHRNIANDIKFPEFILYKPQVGGNVEVGVITTIGFLKDAPHVSVHGFNVYHKNRLILPFWRVLNQTNSRGRGVVGVLEANFIEPTHDKQDFEKTTLLQKLESRLKHMTLEYWDFHCGLIGYHQAKNPLSISVRAHPGLRPVVVNPKSSATSISGAASAGGGFPDAAGLSPSHLSAVRPVVTALSAPAILNSPSMVDTVVHARTGRLFCNYQAGTQLEFPVKRKRQSRMEELEVVKRQATDGADATINGHDLETKVGNNAEDVLQNPETQELIEENEKLRAQCVEYEKIEEELQFKVQKLKIELEEVNHEYEMLLKESQSVEAIKVEKM